MPYYSHVAEGWTPVAHADGASALANNSYQAVRAASALNAIKIVEIYVAGEAGASGVNRIILRRASTNAGTPTNQAPGPIAPFSAAAAAQGYVAATTGPTIASTQHLCELTLNAFGGVVTWRPLTAGAEVIAVTATAPNAELVLDSISGTNIVSTGIKFEEL